MAAVGGDVERVLVGVGGLSLDGVAQRLEVGDGYERRDEVELEELDFLLVGELVERAGLEAREGVIWRGEEGQLAVGAAELVVDLIADFGAPKEAEEDGELPGFDEDLVDVGSGGRTGGKGGRRLG